MNTSGQSKQRFNHAAGDFQNPYFTPQPSYGYRNSYTVAILASELKPLYFNISGKLYRVTSDILCNINLAGADGLDIGTKSADAIYYLYLVVTDRPRAIASLITPDNGGPSGFTEYKYVGAFRTGSASVVPSFKSVNGVMAIDGFATVDATVANTAIAAFTLYVPVTASMVKLRAQFTAVNAAGDFLALTSVNDSSTTFNAARATSTTASNNALTWVWAPITNRVIYASTTSASDSVQIKSYGWIESPWEYES